MLLPVNKVWFDPPFGMTPSEGFSIDDELVAHALSLVLDDLRVCEWVTAEVDRRLNRKGPQDVEFRRTYTSVTNELLDAVRKKNEAD